MATEGRRRIGPEGDGFCEGRYAASEPLFLCPKLAARHFGLPEDFVRELLKEPDPIPYIARGRNKLICVPLARDYLIDRCGGERRPPADPGGSDGSVQG